MRGTTQLHDIVQLLDSHDVQIAAMAVGTLARLVLVDLNRLETWRCGGLDKLLRICGQKTPQVSAVAAETIHMLMAGPRIHPTETFRTASGRTLSAGDMRHSVQRLNAHDARKERVDTLLSRVVNSTSLVSASPEHAGVVHRQTRPPRLRPATAAPFVRELPSRLPRSVTTTPRMRDVGHLQALQHCVLRPLSVRAQPPTDPANASSAFGYRLSHKQERALVDRLARINLLPHKRDLGLPAAPGQPYE